MISSMRALGVMRQVRLGARCISQSTMRRQLSTRTVTSAHKDGGFNELRERDMLRYVISESTEGNPDSITAAMDSFWDTHFNGEGTAEWQLRGAALDQAIGIKAPSTVMELGTYCGYSAVRMGRLLPPGGRLISVEIDPLYAAISTKIVEHAGLNDRVFVEIGSLDERLQAIQKKHGLTGPLDALLLDHEVSSYLPDLRLLESQGLISKGTVVLCDWSLYPGSSDADQAPLGGEEFMDYLAKKGGGPTARHTLQNKDVFTVSSWVGVV